MQVILIGILLTSVMVFAAETDYAEDGGILVLNDANFKKALKEHEFLLVKFYAPWCGHCKKLAPQYSEAAALLKHMGAEEGLKVRLAKLDVTSNPISAKEHDVSSYPTLKFFKNGKEIEYTGGRSSEDITAWVIKRAGPDSFLINNEADLNHAVNGSQVSAVYFGQEDSEEFKVFSHIGSQEDHIPFYHITSPELMKLEGNVKLVLYTKFEHGKMPYPSSSPFTEQAIRKFIDEHRYPLVLSFEEDESIDIVFGKEKPAIFHFYGEEESKFKTQFKDLARAEKWNRESKKLIFAEANFTEGLGARLAQYMGVENDGKESIWIAHAKKTELHKYQYPGVFNTEDVKEFIENWRFNKLSRHYKSQNIPEKNDGNVKVVVGKSYQDIVMGNKKYILLEFYAPWCGHCKEFEPIYNELGARHTDNNKLIISKIDATNNEIPGIGITAFPTIRLYKPDMKHAPVEYTGERKLEAIESFLKVQLGKDYVEVKEDDL